MSILKKLIRKVYYRKYWVSDCTPKLSVWFTKDNKIVDLKSEECRSNTAKVSKWKDVNKLMNDLLDYGSKTIWVTKMEMIFGKRYLTTYTYEVE